MDFFEVLADSGRFLNTDPKLLEKSRPYAAKGGYNVALGAPSGKVKRHVPHF